MQSASNERAGATSTGPVEILDDNNNNFSIDSEGGESKTARDRLLDLFALAKEYRCDVRQLLDEQQPDLWSEYHCWNREQMLSAEQDEPVHGEPFVDYGAPVPEPIVDEPPAAEQAAPPRHEQIVHYGNQLLDDGLPSRRNRAHHRPVALWAKEPRLPQCRDTSQAH